MWDQKREIRRWFWLNIFFVFKSSLEFLYCISLSFPLGSQCPLQYFNRLWGHVARSRSVSEFPEREEVTSVFLCGVCQVLRCYCEGRRTSSMDALLVNVWNLILSARAPVGGNMPPSQSSHPSPFSSSSLSVHSVAQLSLHVPVYIERT